MLQVAAWIAGIVSAVINLVRFVKGG